MPDPNTPTPEKTQSPEEALAAARKMVASAENPGLSPLEAARKMVADADRAAKQAAKENAVAADADAKLCECNASTIPHKHVSSGIVDRVEA